jgi:hypothetical protein
MKGSDATGGHLVVLAIGVGVTWVALELWPTNVLDTPFAQLTVAMLLRFIAALLLGAFGLWMAMFGLVESMKGIGAAFAESTQAMWLGVKSNSKAVRIAIAVYVLVCIIAALARLYLPSSPA